MKKLNSGSYFTTIFFHFCSNGCKEWAFTGTYFPCYSNELTLQKKWRERGSKAKAGRMNIELKSMIWWKSAKNISNENSTCLTLNEMSFSSNGTTVSLDSSSGGSSFFMTFLQQQQPLVIYSGSFSSFLKLQQKLQSFSLTAKFPRIPIWKIIKSVNVAIFWKNYRMIM